MQAQMENASHTYIVSQSRADICGRYRPTGVHAEGSWRTVRGIVFRRNLIPNIWVPSENTHTHTNNQTDLCTAHRDGRN